jgi:hypothetical protein
VKLLQTILFSMFAACVGGSTPGPHKPSNGDNPSCQGQPPPLCFQGYHFDYTNCKCVKD